MAIPAKKLKALVDRDSKPPKMRGKGHDHDDEDEDDHEHGEHDEEDEHEEDEHDDKPKKIDVDAIAKRVHSGKGDKHLMELAEDVDEDHNPPSWVEDEAIWEKAKEAVEPKWDDYDEPYAVVSHVYSAMGGKIKEGEED